MKLRRLSTAALAVTCLLAAAGCGSSSKSSATATTAAAGSSSATTAAQASASSSSSSGGSGLAAATAAVAAASSPLTQIPALPPLPRAPKPGVKVAFLTCSAAACSLLNPGFTDAAKALGWDPTVITYNSATPGEALQQAIDAGNKYIATTSITLSTITPQVEELKAKGIGFYEAYVGDTPEGATNGLYGVASNFTGAAKGAALLADWIISNSGGKANVVYVSLPLYPVLVAGGDGAQAEIKQNCPTCTFATLPVSVNQLGAGQVPSAIVSYLESHPSVNYVDLSFQDLDAGLVQALATAHLASRVKVVGSEAEQAQLKEIIGGTEAAWSIIPENYVMWTVVDWMARESEEVLTPADLAASGPSIGFLVGTPAAAQAQLAAYPTVYPGPTNYEAQFEKLWHVGS
jgi:ABC-type sugar transport system substrate-binding protein